MEKPLDEKKADPKELKMGIEIEMEHTNDKEEAKIIALQHLVEDPNYYTKLNKIIVDPVKESMKSDTIEWLKNNPNPEDEELHKWAEKNGYNIHEVEDIMYQLSTKAIKMELTEEITQLESQIEAIDKSKNPIEKNPENKRNKGTTVDMKNIPEDEENKDKIKDKNDKFVKFELLRNELSNTIREFNELPTIKEKKVRVSDPYSAPPGVNVQVGPQGGYFYDSEDVKKDDKKTSTKDAKVKDLAKTKQ